MLGLLKKASDHLYNHRDSQEQRQEIPEKTETHLYIEKIKIEEAGATQASLDERKGAPLKFNSSDFEAKVKGTLDAMVKNASETIYYRTMQTLVFSSVPRIDRIYSDTVCKGHQNTTLNEWEGEIQEIFKKFKDEFWNDRKFGLIFWPAQNDPGATHIEIFFPEKIREMSLGAHQKEYQNYLEEIFSNFQVLEPGNVLMLKEQENFHRYFVFWSALSEELEKKGGHLKSINGRMYLEKLSPFPQKVK